MCELNVESYVDKIRCPKTNEIYLKQTKNCKKKVLLVRFFLKWKKNYKSRLDLSFQETRNRTLFLYGNSFCFV